MKKRFRIAIVVLASVVTAMIGVGTGSPANAADVITIANYDSAGQLCAEPASGGNGEPVVLRTCTGAPTQAWARTSVGGGYYYMINQGYPNMCMDVRNGQNASGVTIQIWSCTNTNGMKWSFRGVVYPYDNIESRVGRDTVRGKCLDVAGFYAVAGARLVINQCYVGDTTQVWEIR